MDISLIGVPLYYGCDRKGVELGPDKLREMGILDVFKKEHHKIWDVGDIHIPEVLEEDKYKEHGQMKFLDPLVKVNEDLAKKVYDEIKMGRFPIILGGDHSLGLGSVSGASKFCEELAVIWIDAHGDLNTSETSPSGNIHGMPLAAAMGIGNPLLTDLYFKGVKVKPENVYIIGARDLDPGEVQLIKEKDINVYYMKEIRHHGINLVVEKMMENIKKSKVKGIHVSFDLDSMDGELVPGTGLPIPEGFSVSEAKTIFKNLIETELVKSLDFVELNPLLDREEKTAKLSNNLLEYISKVLDR